MSETTMIDKLLSKKNQEIAIYLKVSKKSKTSKNKLFSQKNWVKIFF